MVEALLKKQKAVYIGNWQQEGNNKGINKDLVRSNAGGRNFGGSNFGGRLNEPRRQPRAYYRCGDRYFPGHQYKGQLLLLESRREEEVEDRRRGGGWNQ